MVLSIDILDCVYCVFGREFQLSRSLRLRIVPLSGTRGSHCPLGSPARLTELGRLEAEIYLFMASSSEGTLLEA